MNQNQSHPKGSTALKIVLLLFGAGLGSFLANIGYQLNRNYDSIQTWPSVTATITQHEVFEQKPSPGSKMRIPAPFTPQWTYTYLVDEQEYTSHSRSFPDATILTFKPTREEALNELNKYPIGQPVTIFYNPSAFNETILEKWPRNSSKEYIFYGLGLTVFLISLFVPRLLIKKN